MTGSRLRACSSAAALRSRILKLRTSSRSFYGSGAVTLCLNNNSGPSLAVSICTADLTLRSPHKCQWLALQLPPRHEHRVHPVTWCTISNVQAACSEHSSLLLSMKLPQELMRPWMRDFSHPHPGLDDRQIPEQASEGQVAHAVPGALVCRALCGPFGSQLTHCGPVLVHGAQPTGHEHCQVPGKLHHATALRGYVTRSLR